MPQSACPPKTPGAEWSAGMEGARSQRKRPARHDFAWHRAPSVGVSLLAIAVRPLWGFTLKDRDREQAHSYRGGEVPT